MWLYQGKEFVEADIGQWFGFVYCITDIATGRRYIGQKRFWFKRTLNPLKGQKRKRRVVVPSDWQEYYGSNAELQALVAACPDPLGRFDKQILYLCKTAAHLSYMESKEIFARDCLISPQYFNAYVSCRIHSSHVKNLSKP